MTINDLTKHLKRQEKEKKLWQIAAGTSLLWFVIEGANVASSWWSVGIGLAIFALVVWFFYSYLPDYKGNRWLLVGGILMGLFVGVPFALWIVGHILVWLHVIP